MHVCYVQCHPFISLQHEKASVDMFDHLVKENNLKPMMEKYNLSDTDLKFIKEQIAGPSGSKDMVEDFLFNVVYKLKYCS